MTSNSRVDGRACLATLPSVIKAQNEELPADFLAPPKPEKVPCSMPHLRCCRTFSFVAYTSEFRVLRAENVRHVKHRSTPASRNLVLVQVSVYLFN